MFIPHPTVRHTLFAPNFLLVLRFVSLIDGNKLYILTGRPLDSIIAAARIERCDLGPVLGLINECRS